MSISEAKSRRNSKDLKLKGLLSDETSKFDKKYEGIHVSDEEGNIYVLGLRNIASKSGQDNTLQTLQQILRDVEDFPSLDGRESANNITSTMSDRASTQIKFNELLEDYRREILPLTIENYEQLSEPKQPVTWKTLQFLLRFTCRGSLGRNSILCIARG